MVAPYGRETPCCYGRVMIPLGDHVRPIDAVKGLAWTDVVAYTSPIPSVALIGGPVGGPERVGENAHLEWRKADPRSNAKETWYL